MIHKNFKAYALMTCLMASGSVSPLREKWVIPGTAASALGGGTAGYFISSGLESSQIVKVIATLAGAAGCGALAHWLLYRITPQGRYNRAMKTINAAVFDGFVTLELSQADEYKSLKSYCKTNYESDWYLVSGKMWLNRLKNDLVWAWLILEAAQQEANYSLAGQCQDGKQQSEMLKAKVLHLLDLVDSDSTEYHRQRKAYDAYLERLQREQHHDEDRYQRWSEQSDRRHDKRLDRELKKELHREKMDAKKTFTEIMARESIDTNDDKSKRFALLKSWEENLYKVFDQFS